MISEKKISAFIPASGLSENFRTALSADSETPASATSATSAASATAASATAASVASFKPAGSSAFMTADSSAFMTADSMDSGSDSTESSLSNPISSNSTLSNSTSPSSCPIHLNDISGIGPVLEKKLIDFFGSEENALSALLSSNTGILSCIPGITTSMAENLMAAAADALRSEKSGISKESKEKETKEKDIGEISKEVKETKEISKEIKEIKEIKETKETSKDSSSKTIGSDSSVSAKKSEKSEKSENIARAGDFLKTKECEAVYSGIVKIAREFCHTSHARNYVEKMVPYPSSKMDRICAIREKMNVYGALTKNIPEELSGTIAELLTGMTPAENPAPVRSTDKAIITFTEKTFTQARERFGDYLRVHLVSDATECRDLFVSYRSVILFDFPEFDLPGDNYVYFKDPAKTPIGKILPESGMAYFVKNRKSIQNALTLSSLLMDEKILMALPESGSSKENKSVSSENFSKEDIEKVLTILSGLDKEGKPEPGKDPEYSRLKNIYENIGEAVLREAAAASEKISAALSGTQLTLDGSQMMQIFSGNADLKTIIASQVSKSYDTIVKEALLRISSEFSLKPEEDSMIRYVFGDEIECPLKADSMILDAFKKEILSDIRKREEDCCKKTAAELSGYRESCDSLINACLDFDIWYSLSEFASAYRMNFPEFEKSGTVAHFSIENGRNLSLVKKMGLAKTVPVSYDVDSVVLLSGVNSGGKTSLLDLCSQCVILAHMGLPVPAEKCSITPVEEFYYFGKSKGTLDAGAFETTLRNFSVVTGNKDKIVFADELESITEPGASARIIAGLLETLAANSNILSIFVSHLSEAIAENCDIPIRIDGIDASGLDENLNLIINRTPVKNHVAKSTPELIVEKLVLSSSGNERSFYEGLQKKFKNN